MIRLYFAEGAGYSMGNNLGAFLEAQLAQRRMSMRDLASQSGVSVATISAMINKSREPELATLNALAMALKVSLAELIREVGYHLWEGRTPIEAQLRSDLLTPELLAELERIGPEERSRRLAFLDKVLRDPALFNRVLGYLDALGE